MKYKDCSPEIKKIWKVAYVVQGVRGFASGSILYLWGTFFYEKFTATNGLSPLEAIKLCALFFGLSKIFQVFLEVPTGVIGDVIGRKWTVMLSYLSWMLLFIFMALIPFISNINAILVLGILIMLLEALNLTFFSGAFIAWCVDSLQKAHPGFGYEMVISSSYTFLFLCQILGGAICVYTYLSNYVFIGFLVAATALCFGVVFCMFEMEEHDEHSFLDIKSVSLGSVLNRMADIFSIGFKVFSQSRGILILALIFTFSSFVVEIIDYFWPVHLRANFSGGLQNIAWLGLIVVVPLLCSFGSYSVSLFVRNNDKEDRAAKLKRLKFCFFLSMVMQSIPVLLLSYSVQRGLNQFFIFLFVISFVQFVAGARHPSYESLINYYIPEEHSRERATIMSFANLFASLVIGLLAIPSSGPSGEKTALGWALPASLLLVSTVLGYFILKRNEKKLPKNLQELCEVTVDDFNFNNNLKTKEGTVYGPQ